MGFSISTTLKRYHEWIYVLLIFLGGVLLYGRFVQWGFWKDDWGFFWGSRHLTSWFLGFILHPGTLGEFLVFERIFGQNPLLWQVLGILLKIIASHGVAMMTHRLTGNANTGYIAGIAYLVSVAGIDGVTWNAAHVVVLITICSTYGISWSIGTHPAFSETTQRVLAFVFLLAALFFDPGRSAMVMPLLAIIPYVLHRTRGAFQVPTVYRYGVLAMIFFVFLSLFIIRKEFSEVRIVQQFGSVMTHPALAVEKMKYLGNYAASIGNLMLGWAIPLPEEASTGVYTRTMGRVGVMLILSMILGSIAALRSTKQEMRSIGFALVWIIATYIPGWIFEPRLTMGISHRYMMLSSVGLAILVAVFISSLNKRIGGMVCMLFVIANMAAIHRYYVVSDPYRSALQTERVYETIMASIPPGHIPVIITGDHPFYRWNVMYAYLMPIVVKRDIHSPIDFPIFFNSVASFRPYLETPYSYRVQAVTVTLAAPFSIRSVYAFHIDAEGNVEDRTSAIRSELQGKGLSEVIMSGKEETR